MKKKEKKKDLFAYTVRLGRVFFYILLSGFYVFLSPLRKIVEIQGLSRQHIDYYSVRSKHDNTYYCWL